MHIVLLSLAFFATLSLMYLSRGLWRHVGRALSDPWVYTPLIGLGLIFAMLAAFYLVAVYREWQTFAL